MTEDDGVIKNRSWAQASDLVKCVVPNTRVWKNIFPRFVIPINVVNMF